MTTNGTARRSGAVGLVAGALWCVLSIASLATPDPERYLDALFLAPFLLTAPAFVGLHLFQRDHLGRLGRVAFWISSVAMVAILIGQMGQVFDIDAIVWLGFPAGLLAWVVGFALYGIATIRAGALPRWAGGAIALSQPLAILLGVAFSPISPLADYGDYSGALGHGLVWLAIGWALLTAEVGASTAPAARGVILPEPTLQGADTLS